MARLARCREPCLTYQPAQLIRIAMMDGTECPMTIAEAIALERINI